MGGIWANWKFRITKIILLRYHLEHLQLLAHQELLLLVSLCHGLLTMVRPSSVCLLVPFHIFDISMIDAMAAILNDVNCYLLPNRKWDGAKTWWKSLGQHGD